jgi:hypothetical protein
MLTISEKLFLLSIDDGRGKVTSFVSSSLRYGLAGAVLAELALLGNVAVEDKVLKLVDYSPIGNDLFDEVLTRISQEKRLHKPGFWVNVLASRKLQKQIAEQLEAKNILRIEEKRYFWVIPYELYPQQDASAKYWVKQQLRSVVLAGDKSQPDIVVLLSLLKACSLLNLVFTRDERKSAGKRLDALVKGEVFGDVVAKTIEEIETAAAAATMAAIAG